MLVTILERGLYLLTSLGYVALLLDTTPQALAAALMLSAMAVSVTGIKQVI